MNEQQTNMWVTPKKIQALTGMNVDQLKRFRVQHMEEGVHFKRQSKNGYPMWFNRVEIDRLVSEL